MRKAIVTPIVAGLIGFAALAAPVAAQASQDPQGTTTTFTLSGPSGAALTISVPESADLSSSGSTVVTASSLSGSLGGITVTDDRAAYHQDWTASVTSSDFTNESYSGAVEIAAGSVDYAPGTVTPSTGLTLASGNTGGALDGTTSVTAAASSAEVGVNSATWSPEITVHLPPHAVAGTYSGTITHSVG